MSDPNHPIFKQFPELDPSTIVIRDSPHPDWVWNQPPIMGTLTPGYAQRIPEEPCLPSSVDPRTPPTGGSQVQSRPQQWRHEFPGLWDDIPGSGTTMAHARPYPLPPSRHDLPTLATGHSEKLSGSAGRLPEPQDRSGHSAANGGTAERKFHKV